MERAAALADLFSADGGQPKRVLPVQDDRVIATAIAKLAIRISTVLGLSLLLSACATVDFDHPRTASSAWDRSEDTHLSRRIRAGEAAHPDQSGFYLLDDGIDALSARLLLSKRAEHSIDAQYYFILDDPTSYAFLEQLLDAADRGVRVRLLIDDIHTGTYDRGLEALDSHPNFEIRIFNPFARRTGRMLDFVTDFGRANRRMHNKSFTVDGVATIVGGRNIGAEYFAARGDVNFTDLDVLGVGPVARDVGATFDSYWNSEFALPIAAIVAPQTGPDAGLPALRDRFETAIDTLKQTKYAEALIDTVLEQIDIAADMLVWADYQVVSDSPSKARADGEGHIDALTAPLAAAIDVAESELFVTSPYFVPRKRGVEAFRKIRERGIEVVIWTNSLAATDVKAVHAGYAPYRRDLLEAGVELYEAHRDTRVAGAKRGGMGRSSASLHAKWFTIDRSRLFVGSFNWDPRSIGINTEMGILIDSPELATHMVDATLAEFPHTSYRVYLDQRNRLRWSSSADEETIVSKREPGTSFWERFSVSILRLLPIQDQL
jgi:putative cardiolipin synthase